MDEEYLVTAFVPSDTACFASSPGRMSRTLQILLVDVGFGDFGCNIRRLNLSGRDGRFLIISGELGCLGCNPLKDICVKQSESETRRGWQIGLPLTKEFRMDMARLEMPVSGWTCLSTIEDTLEVFRRYDEMQMNG